MMRVLAFIVSMGRQTFAQKLSRNVLRANAREAEERSIAPFCLGSGRYQLQVHGIQGFPGGSAVKNLPAMQEPQETQV